MAFIQCDFRSKVMGMSTQINVIIPEKLRYVNREGGFPTLYLLHGLSEDNTGWCRYTSIERYAEKRGIIVVMPWAGKSFYNDMRYGEKVFTYITEELPKFCEQTFPISSKREDRFVAGLSMGGYGSFKLALSRPDLYCAAASLSGSLDIVSSIEREKDNLYYQAMLEAIYGENTLEAMEKASLFKLIDALMKNKVDLPNLYMICGTEDFLYEGNQKFAKHLKELGVEAKIRWEPGKHEWEFWDKYIQEVLEWLPVRE